LPRHWQHWTEKTREIRKIFENYYPVDDLENTRAVVIGNTAAFSESMKLLHLQASRDAQKDEHASWPEFAAFDCYACHHELRVPSWRQNKPAGQTGRPLPATWPTVLVRLSMHALDSKNEEEQKKAFEQKLGQLQAAYTAGPFGNADSIARAAQDLQSWSETLLGRLKDAKQVKFDRTKARALLEKLCGLGQAGDLDFDAARQLAWAFERVVTELDPKFESKSFADLKKALDLELPATQENEIKKDLPVRFRALEDYKPTDVQARFRELARQLPRN